jgi:hypothetical protein
MATSKRKQQARIDDVFSSKTQQTDEEVKLSVQHDTLRTRSIMRFMALDETSFLKSFLEMGEWKERPRVIGAPRQQSFVDTELANSEPHCRVLKSFPGFVLDRLGELFETPVSRVDVFKLTGTRDKLVQWLNPEDRDGDAAVLALGSDWLIELRRLRSSETERNRLVLRLKSGTLLFFPSEAARLYERNVPAGKSFPISKITNLTRNNEFELYLLAFYSKRGFRTKKSKVT